MSILFVTHNLGVVAEIAARRGGDVCRPRGRDRARSMRSSRSQRHPYTQGLLACIPTASAAIELGGERPRLTPIPGNVPSVPALPPGCAFAPRCPYASRNAMRDAAADCRRDPAHVSRCWRHERAMSGRPLARDLGMSCSASQGLTKQFPTRAAAWCRRSRTSASMSAAARSSGSSANPARARPRPGAACCGCRADRRAGRLRRRRSARRRRTRDMRAYRRRMQIVFQDPYSSLNPRLRIEDIIGEALDMHGLARRRARGATASPNCSRGWACDPEQRAASRTNSPAASASASASRARSRSSPIHRGGRAGLGARRFGAGAGAQPAAGPAEELRPHDAVHRARSRRWSSISATRWS